MGIRGGMLAALTNHTNAPTSADTDVNNWLGRVYAAGGTVSPTRQTIVETFVAGLKSDSLFTKIQRLNMFVGDQLAACLIPLINTLGNSADTSVNHVSGDFSTTLGLKGDGSTKYLITGAMVPTASACGLSMYIPAQDTGGSTYRFIGSNESGSGRVICLHRGNASSHQARLLGPSIAATVAANLPASCLFHAERRSTTDLEVYENGVSKVNVATAMSNTTVPAIGMFVGCQNSDGTPNNFVPSGVYLGGYSVTLGLMSDADATNYSSRWATLRSSL